MRQLKSASLIGLLIALQLVSVRTFALVEVKENQLTLDGTAQPQLFGAELQYFRLRGGYGKNIPKAQVIALWNQALDRMVEAKMNTISFYIPWDFHEYAEGRFDFTGTADEDHDGKPDYPSRDLVTFFKLIENHGIHRILVRPGPYINAEWGFLGFGAIPQWFHQKFPESHMQTSWGWKTSLYDYHNPELLRHTELWFKALYEQVLKDRIGPHKPIVFLQLDNETNFQWQSIYNHDYSPQAVTRYQQFLQGQYQKLETLNEAHHREWSDWSQVKPPRSPGANIAEDRDWYRFADVTMYSYLIQIRQMWERLGVHEPQVLFSLAESYNATDHGVLPNFRYRNAQGLTGMMTVNLYPKTDETSHAFLNFPFKADLDVKSADAANDSYFGSKQEWVMGPEIQAGWWKDTSVSAEARLQTYLTVIGHGLKAFYVYYFNEGQNFDVEWGYNQTKPLLEALRKERHLEDVPLAELSNEFWGELQARADRLVVMGIDVRRILQKDPLANQDLYFDAPLDGHAQPRSHFYQLKDIGNHLIEPFQDFLARSLEVLDPVGLVKDTTQHEPSAASWAPGTQASSDWAGGLLGSLMTADVNPSIIHGDLAPSADFDNKVLFHIDSGHNSIHTLQQLQDALHRNQTVVNFLASSVSEMLGLPVKATPVTLPGTDKELTFYLDSADRLVSGGQPDARAFRFAAASAPAFTYTLASDPTANCEGLLYWSGQTVGYQCHGKNLNLVQIGNDFFKVANSGDYGSRADQEMQKVFFKAMLRQAGVRPALKLSDDAKFTVAFARKDPRKKILWITVKTGADFPQTMKIKIGAETLAHALSASDKFLIQNPLAHTSETIPADVLIREGFPILMKAHGSAVFVVQPTQRH